MPNAVASAILNSMLGTFANDFFPVPQYRLRSDRGALGVHLRDVVTHCDFLPRKRGVFLEMRHAFTPLSLK